MAKCPFSCNKVLKNSRVRIINEDNCDFRINVQIGDASVRITESNFEELL